MNITYAMIGTAQLVIKYFLEKIASSTKVKVGMKVNLGLSYQFINM
jgi:hypothetical protein